MWAVIRPFINIVIFGLISQFIEQSANLTEKFLVVSGGVIIWGLISTSITDSTNSVVSNGNILTKVYFPKIIIPFSSLAVCMIDFLISFTILVILRLVLLGMPGIEFLLIPFILIYTMLFSFAIGLYCSALNVKYRDVKFILPFILQIGFYISPVFLSTAFYLEKMPSWLHTVFLANPLVVIVDAFKYAMFGSPFIIPFASVVTGIVITLVLSLLSVRYFVKFEKSFADYI